MNDNTREPDDIKGPLDILSERSLAVDLAIAEIDQQIATAHKYPRSIDHFVKALETMACYNEAAALNSIYSLPRAGKAIIGPSIGFANACAQAWGNCVDAARIVHVDRKEKMVVCEGAFHDLQTNRRTIIPEQRRIVDSKGRLYSDDMIITTSKAGASIARRNAILQAVPRPLWFPVYEQALLIVRGSVETFGERKDKALKSFAQFGITPAQIVAFIGLKGEPDLTLDHIPTLRGAYAALRDGALTPEEVLDPRRQAAGAFETVSNPLADDEHDPKTGEGSTGATAASVHEHVHTGESERARGPRQDGESDHAPGGDEAPPAATLQAAQPAAASTTPQAGASTAAPQEPAAGDGKPTAATRAKRDRKKPAADKGAPATHMDTSTGAISQVGAQEPGKSPDPKPADPKTTEATLPASPEQYQAYAKSWIAGATSLSGLEDRWRSERELRTTCRVVEDVFTDVKAAKDARAAELKKG